MNLSKQIKENRKKMSLSQEELAEKAYVTRQTISNWENDKSYPDINSLIILSSLFNISIDELVKGDVDTMREYVSNEVINKFQKMGVLYAIGLVIAVVSIAPLFMFFRWTGMVIWFVYFILVMMLALKIEKFKKEHDVQTYKEIVAFMDGKKLDEIQKATEKGKRPYQKIFYAIISALIGFTVTYLLLVLLMG
ncbi:helix-turn-helix domain-containing protein [Peptostreptococcus faecalis]|uniref:helix-turn-helix domain-containing protein n=1 Tax=Peptostreptococcus faecalis TaxID=2045015 RepID=UPI000C7D083F|nr:helix-turn-helix transcriptional regulator [Peptostreptococcus faecalis]